MIRIVTDEPRFFTDLGDVLRLFYGDDYTITADSEIDKGTVIRISVPDHMREPG